MNKEDVEKYNLHPHYDSHVHFFGTGLPAVEWDIRNNQKFNADFLQKEIIRGYGWENAVQFLETVKKYPEKSFFLSKIDGHTAFMSHALVAKLNLDTSDLEKFMDVGFIVYESQKDFVERFLPKRSLSDLTKMALYSQDIFLKAGFKKVRHLTCTKEHWVVLQDLHRDGFLKLEIECFFSEFMEQSFEEAIENFDTALPESNKLIKACGLKVFYDGSFGSKTAFSFLFPEAEPRINLEQLKNRMEVALELNCDIAVHTIGEKAVEDTIKAFSEVFSSSNGKPKTTLHIEHCPALTKESISQLEKLPVKIHLQPSHYKGDKPYLDKIAKKGYLVYPFKEFHEAGIKFYFGSDSPVEEPQKLS